MSTWVEASAYNISAASLVFPVSTRAKLKSYIVQTPGTAGVLTFNDCATLADASAANQIISIPYNLNAGSGDIWPAPFDWPINSGIVISAVPTGLVLAVSYEFLVP
ncbi:MAG: hypothetical protein ACLQKH_09365 [Steroidobacteraceae bacterium]